MLVVQRLVFYYSNAAHSDSLSAIMITTFSSDFIFVWARALLSNNICNLIRCCMEKLDWFFLCSNFPCDHNIKVSVKTCSLYTSARSYFILFYEMFKFNLICFHLTKLKKSITWKKTNKLSYCKNSWTFCLLYISKFTFQYFIIFGFWRTNISCSWTFTVWK